MNDDLRSVIQLLRQKGMGIHIKVEHFPDD